MQEVEIGKVTHYFGKASVAIIQITQGELKVGDTIHLKGHTSDFTEKIDSMQVEHQSVQKASPGESVGVKVNQHAREHDVVYKITG
jgi:putative protease